MCNKVTTPPLGCFSPKLSKTMCFIHPRAELLCRGIVIYQKLIDDSNLKDLFQRHRSNGRLLCIPDYFLPVQL